MPPSGHLTIAFSITLGGTASAHAQFVSLLTFSFQIHVTTLTDRQKNRNIGMG